MRKIIGVLLISAPAPSFAQLVERPPFEMSAEFPQAELRGYGIGNLGFDAPLNTYDPHYAPLDGNVFRVSVSGLYLYDGRRTYPPNDESPVAIEADEFSSPVIPSIGMLYMSGHVMVQLCYYQDLDFTDRVTGLTTYRFVSESRREYVAQSPKRDIQIRQRTLRADLSYSIDSWLSGTSGLLTKDFRYEWDIKTMAPAVYENNMFDRYQIFLGIAATPAKNVQTYLSFLTQDSRVDLSQGVFHFPAGTLILPAATKVSYYGNIGYGVQVGILPQLKLSLEMRHQFLEDSSDVVKSDGFIAYDKRHIWNNEITVGANAPLTNGVQVGVRYSRFLKYDSRKGILRTEGIGRTAIMTIANPYSLAFAAQVTHGEFCIQAGYQYAKSEYAYRGTTALSDAFHEAWVLVSYSLSFE